MTYAREKRVLLGIAALLVGLPLPFNEVLEWPALALFCLVVLAFMRRAWLGSERWLEARALNLLGLAYLPFLFFDLGATGRIQPIRPILHLILFGLGAKLWSLAKERDKWQAWIGIFFLFLAAMATSTHPAVVVYLLAFVGSSVALMLRFVQLHLLSSFGKRGAAPTGLPVGRFVVLLLTATVIVAAPLFALLPRVRNPLVTGVGGFGGQRSGSSAGFSDEMSLDLIGRIRDNREIALRARFEGRYPRPDEQYWKAATYDSWRGRSWRASPSTRRLTREMGVDAFRLSPERSVGSATIFLEPIRTTSLVLPATAVEVEIGASVVSIDEGGALSLPGMPMAVLKYGVLLGREARSLAATPDLASPLGPLDATGITQRMRELAAEWAGSSSDGEMAAAIERRFHSDFLYTTAFVGRGGESPLERFLFESRRGHCEYFASAMVLLLRAQGIPARLVTGFYGAEWSAFESSWLVRQSNAHAWVEAWVAGEGWRRFDPTPPDGRPLSAAPSFRLYAVQAWEAVLFSWDRWVISYDFEDQIGVLGDLRRYWSRLTQDLFGRGEKRLEPPVPTAAGGGEAAATPSDLARLPGLGWKVGVVLTALAAAAGAFWIWRRRPPWTATIAYRRLRAALVGSGIQLTPAVAPLALARLAAHRLPEAAQPTARVVDGYLREAFAGAPPDSTSALALKSDLVAVEAAIRRARRRKRGRRVVRPAVELVG